MKSPVKTFIIVCMKKFTTFLKILLLLIAVCAVGWYAFGENGPLYEQGQSLLVKAEEIFNKEVNQDADDSVNVTEDNLATDDSDESESDLSDEDLITTIVFTGDVEISEYVQANYDEGGVDSVISESLQSLMKDATYTMVNNEFCYSTRGEQAADKQYTFRVDPSYVSLLTDLGVDSAGLANNHVLDYGHDALTDTFTTLTGAGIDYTGAGDSLTDASKLLTMTDAKGRTYGFLAASHVIPVASWNVENSQPGVFCFYDETELINAIEEADSQVDYLFVMVHWGTEHTTELTDYQVSDGHMLIDAGADAVIGMHSHCLQSIEYYNGCPIFYSLGNFIFNQTISTGGGGAVEVTIDENDNISFRIIPIMASGAKTYEAIESDSTAYSYVEDISENVAVDENGYISEKNIKVQN